MYDAGLYWEPVKLLHEVPHDLIFFCGKQDRNRKIKWCCLTDEHSGGRVVDADGLEDGGTVVGHLNGLVAGAALQNLVLEHKEKPHEKTEEAM